MYACLCIHINYTTQHIIATGTGTGAVLINKRDERCTLRLGVHHHQLRSAHEQSATKRRHREIPVLHDAVDRGDHAGKKTLASTRTVERGRRLADCVNEVERRPVKDSIRADDDGEEVACGSINLRASGDARVRLQLQVGRQVELVNNGGLQRSEHVAHGKGTRGGVLTQSLERSERDGVDRFPVHLHDRDVTVDVLSSGAAENVRTPALSDENTIGVDELGFWESRLDHNGAAAIASGNAGEVITDLVMADLLTTLECHTRLRLEVTVN